MARPDTCGAEGGAISLWVNVIDCRNIFFYDGGIVSSIQDGVTTGSLIFCYYEEVGYDTHVFTSIPHKLEKCYKSSCS